MSPGRRLQAVGALVGVGLLLYWGTTRRLPPAEAPKPYPAIELSLPDLTGKIRTLSELRAEAGPPGVVLLDFWATWCFPCQAELPDLIRLHAAYKRRGFTVIGVSVDEDGRDAVAPYAKENAIPYPLLLSPGKVAGYKVPGIPTAFLIDKDNMVARTYYGPKTFEALSKDIEAALAAALDRSPTER